MLVRLSQIWAVLIAALFLAAAAWCFVPPPASTPPAMTRAAPGHYTDMMLYRDIVASMQQGSDYYSAAAEQQRARGYPTRPFVTIRQPTLYLLAASYGWDRLNLLETALLIANVLLWPLALPAPANVAERLGAGLALGVGGFAAAACTITPMSEVWCGLLLGLALAARTGWRAQWWWPVLAVGAALTVRELALPFLMLAAAFALHERRWREFYGWTLVATLFALGTVIHASAVFEVAREGDFSSQGWAGGLGLRGVLQALVSTSLLHKLPRGLALLIALLPVLGWAALEPRAGRFALLLLGGYAAMIGLFPRPDNFYWGFLLLPAWFAGLALVPRGVWQLGQAIARPAGRPIIHPDR